MRSREVAAVTLLFVCALVLKANYPHVDLSLRKPEQVSYTYSFDSNIDLTGSANVRLTLCVPKTGTSALEWITQSLFDHFSGVAGGEAVVVKKYKKHALKWRQNVLRLDVNGKHYADVNRDAPELGVASAKAFCLKTHTPAYSDKAFRRISHLQAYPNASAQKSGEKAGRQLFFTTFRDPIATTVSWVYYKRGKIGMSSLSNHIMGNDLCADTAADMALRYRLVTEFLPSRGYEINPLFFEDMRQRPKDFIKKYAESIGLRVNEEIVTKTMEETSVEHMKQIQRSFKRDPGNHSKEEYSGLSGTGLNARKVRKAEVKGYVNELNEKALRYCRRAAAFHLPKALRERWGFTDVEVVRPLDSADD